MRRSVLASLSVLLISGCGTAAVRSKPQAKTSVDARSQLQAKTDAVAHQQICSSGTTSSGSQEVSNEETCEYVLRDGRRFNCRMASIHKTALSIKAIKANRACTALPRVQVASRAVISAIDHAEACMIGAGLIVKGGPIPPAGHDPGGPEGELIVGITHGGGALIAFYANLENAKLAEPEVQQNARSFHGEVERRGTATILWLQTPSDRLRSAAQRCIPT
ncbi:MAG TPA: hypothetical protein VGH21_07360 [Solirubrobacteraceae bacterium]|jgi:hypothetical protein